LTVGPPPSIVVLPLVMSAMPLLPLSEDPMLSMTRRFGKYSKKSGGLPGLGGKKIGSPVLQAQGNFQHHLEQDCNRKRYGKRFDNHLMPMLREEVEHRQVDENRGEIAQEKLLL
jgi:hypothetical protein